MAAWAKASSRFEDVTRPKPPVSQYWTRVKEISQGLDESLGKDGLTPFQLSPVLPTENHAYVV